MFISQISELKRKLAQAQLEAELRAADTAFLKKQVVFVFCMYVRVYWCVYWCVYLCVCVCVCVCVCACVCVSMYGWGVLCFARSVLIGLLFVVVCWL